jgi:hypothetical protein
MVILASSLTRSSSKPRSAQFIVICRINSSEGREEKRREEKRREKTGEGNKIVNDVGSHMK